VSAAPFPGRFHGFEVVRLDHPKRGVCVRKVLPVLAVALFLAGAVTAQERVGDAGGSAESKVIPPQSKVFITPIEGGFDTYLSAALIKKEVPLTVVTMKEKADFEITGIAESDKAGWAKMMFLGNGQSNEQASIKVTNLKTGVVAFAYAANKGSAARGKQSAAESCAKHLKARIEGRE
jgi:hypothetical protein